MKKVILTIILITISFSYIFADEIVSLTDGRQISLKDDGTFEFIENEGIVTIVLTDARETTSWGDDYLTLTFRIENNSYGTIYRLRIPIIVYDDRGVVINEYKEINTVDWDTYYINKGASQEIKVNISDGKLEFLGEIIAGDTKPHYLNMRNLPEGIQAKDLLVFRSDVEGVRFHN